MTKVCISGDCTLILRHTELWYFPEKNHGDNSFNIFFGESPFLIVTLLALTHWKPMFHLIKYFSVLSDVCCGTPGRKNGVTWLLNVLLVWCWRKFFDPFNKFFSNGVYNYQLPMEYTILALRSTGYFLKCSSFLSRSVQSR